MSKILVTGAAGGIGTRMRQLLPAIYPDIRWSDIRKPDDLKAGEEFVQADLAELAQVEAAVKGVDGIVHLGGFSVEGPWETILAANIIGCRNMYEAAYRARRQARHLRLVQPRRRLLPAQPRRSASTSPCVRIRATASARRSARRWARSMPTSTACASPVCASAISATRRSTCAGCRSGSSRRTWCSSSASASSIPTFTSKSSTARPTMPPRWWDNSNAVKFGYKPTGRAEDFRAQAEEAQKKLPADPVGDKSAGRHLPVGRVRRG